MIQYTTRSGDMLDAICYRVYGSSQRYTEAVRDANPQLSDYGPVLPEGLSIQLPDLTTLTRQQNTIRLWD